MASAAYHRRQAETLIRLVNSTVDPGTATELIRLAAEHVALVEEEVLEPELYPPPDELSRQEFWEIFQLERLLSAAAKKPH
jgi:hypothetical protein